MLKIKLTKIGKKNAPVYRISVGGTKRVVEYLGIYNPQYNPPLLQVDKAKVQEWVKKGAHLSPAVSQILKGKYSYRKYVPKLAGSDGEAPADVQAAPAAEVKAPAQEEPKAEEKTKEKDAETPPQE